MPYLVDYTPHVIIHWQVLVRQGSRFIALDPLSEVLVYFIAWIQELKIKAF